MDKKEETENVNEKYEKAIAKARKNLEALGCYDIWIGYDKDIAIDTYFQWDIDRMLGLAKAEGFKDRFGLIADLVFLESVYCNEVQLLDNLDMDKYPFITMYFDKYVYSDKYGLEKILQKHIDEALNVLFDIDKNSWKEYFKRIGKAKK